MKAIARLKDQARKHEQQENWHAAIEAYQRVLETEQKEEDLELELGLFNRVGDLHLRLRQIDEAVSYYETAADKYAESGFLNNAIALCNKALRHRPDRLDLYLKLSGFCAEQGFFTDARRWTLEYAERQMQAGEVDAALEALTDLADLSDDPELRVLLADRLADHDRREVAVEQLRRAYRQYAASGEHEDADEVAARARELNGTVDFAADETIEPLGHDTPSQDRLPALGGAWPGHETGGEPGVEDREPEAGETAEEAAAEAGVLEGLESTHVEPEVEEPDEGTGMTLGGLETFEAETPAEPPAPEETLEPEPPGAGVEPVPNAGLEPELTGDEEEPMPLLEAGFDEEQGEEPQTAPLLDFGQEEPETGGATLEPAGTAEEPDVDLNAVLENLAPAEEAAAQPDPELAAMLSQLKEQMTEPSESGEPGNHYDLGLAFKDMGLIDEAVAEFQTALKIRPHELKVYEELGHCLFLGGRYEAALQVLEQALHVPNATGSDLLGIYYHLGQSHEKLGQRDRARDVYQKVLSIDDSFADVPSRMAQL